MLFVIVDTNTALVAGLVAGLLIAALVFMILDTLFLYAETL